MSLQLCIYSLVMVSKFSKKELSDHTFNFNLFLFDFKMTDLTNYVGILHLSKLTLWQCNLTLKMDKLKMYTKSYNLMHF